jgi:hypothetical protein
MFQLTTLEQEQQALMHKVRCYAGVGSLQLQL